MNIGTLTGQITLEDALTGVLMKVNAALKATSSVATASMAEVSSSMRVAATVGAFFGTMLSNVAMQTVSWFKNIVTGSLGAGLRLEQLGVATRFLGEKAGYTGPYIDQLAKDIEATGISGIASREAIQSLLGANIDLANASKLSAIAQNMQSLSGKSSSAVFQTLTRAIATGNTELLRGVGFQNISIDALSRQRKAQTGNTEALVGAARSGAILNAILAEGAQKSGLYAESMTTAGKQASSAERAWDQVSERIGTVLLPITSVAIKAWYALGQAVRDSVTSSGGAVAGFIKGAAEGLQNVINMTAKVASTSVQLGKDLYDAYYKLPALFRSIGETALIAAAGAWALNSAINALVASKVVVWAVAAAGSFNSWATFIMAFKWAGVTVLIKTLGGTILGIVSTPLFAVAAGLTAIWGAWKIGHWEPVSDFFERLGLRLYGVTGAAADAAIAANKLNDVFKTRPGAGISSRGDVNLPLPVQPPKPPPEVDLEYEKKISTLTKTLREGSAELSVFQDAFKRLTVTQLSNYSVLQRVIPEIDKLRAAGVALSTQQLKAVAAYEAEKVMLLAKQVAMLGATGITLQSVEAMKQAGLSEADIARKYDTSTEALTEVIRVKTEARDLSYEMAEGALDLEHQAWLRYVKDQEAAEAATDQLQDVRKEYEAFVKETTSSGTDFAIFQIKRETEARILAFKGTEAQMKEHDTMMRAMETKRIANLFIDNSALEANSKTTLNAIRDKAWTTYKEMQKHPEEYSQHAKNQHRKIAEAASHAAAGTKAAWEKAYDALGAVATILDDIPGQFAEIASIAARTGQVMIEAFQAEDWTKMVTAGITGAIAIGQKLWQSLNDGRKAIKDFAKSFGGFNEMHSEMSRLGAGSEQMWISLTQGTARGNKSEAERKIKEIQAALKALDDDISKYNLTWMDMVDKQTGGTRAADALVASVKRLTAAGYDNSSVIAAMGGDINQFIVNSIRAGTKIPPALQPIITDLIRMGGLTREAAAAMLGLEQSTMPTLADITEAAGRYGIELDKLGPKVKQLQITETANQIVADFQTLTAAGADFATIMGPISAAEQAVIDLNRKGYDTAAEGTAEWRTYQEAISKWKKEIDDGGESVANMRTQIQGLVTSALAMGLELPEAMRPIIERMIDAGLITDEFGTALTDTTRLTFARDLTTMFDELIVKLDELIDKISTGVGGALSNIGDMVVEPQINVGSGTWTKPWKEPWTEAPEFMAGGGIVRSRGTDTIPAMLTPGEEVLTVAQAAERRSGQSESTSLSGDINMDGMKVGEVLVRVRNRR